MKHALLTGICLLAGWVIPTYAWDPIGDITHPERIVRNVGRELDNAGRELDRLRLEAQAQTGAPAFVEWLQQSRNTASAGASPMPRHIREQLRGFYDENTLHRVRFKIGDAGVFNLANLSLQYGGAAAVTLIDVIVFKSHNDAYNNAELWAHELKHVQQFRDWGVRDFAIRYLRSWNSVEGDAYAAQNSFLAWRNQLAQQADQPPATLPVGQFPHPAIARVCATPYGQCGMGVAVQVGAPCYCPTYNGPIWGVAQ